MADEKPPAKVPLISYVIFPDREPGVIDNAMITQCLLDYGPKEEAGRLYAEEGVHLDEVYTVRLEFKKILRIDHLWMLVNLTRLTLAHNLIEKIENLETLTTLNELDLSFNKIERIQNLETLVNLEVLTLFHNNIRKLENLEAQEKLLVFSIGDNLIEDYKEMTYLRKFRCLRSVSFKGNPCGTDPMTNNFLMSALPRVTYLDYELITDEAREKGASMFRGILRKLDDADEISEKQRLAKEEYDKKHVFYALSFVEYLEGPELLLTMFEKDVDGSTLLSFGGELTPLFETYKEDYVKIMAELVEFAQEAYNIRETETKLFRTLVDNALADSIEKSKAVVKEYETKKDNLVYELKVLIALYQSKEKRMMEIEPDLLELCNMFNQTLYHVWKNLMRIELQLFEQCEDSRVTFSVNMSERIVKLHEAARNAFGQWREIDGNWLSTQMDILMKYLGNKVMLGDASPQLYEIMMDRDLLMNSIAQSSDNHSRFIDAREDVLMTRSDHWKEEVIEGTNDNEVKRNRQRVMEINYYIDNQRADWSDYQLPLHETSMNADAITLLDDFS